MKLYTAGPMTGHPYFNYPAFIKATEDLRALGYEVISPIELDDQDDRAAALASPNGSILTYTHGTGKTWGDFLARDVKLLADDDIDAVVVLPGWKTSRGARLEVFVGHLCGLPTYELWAVLRGIPVRLEVSELVHGWTGLSPRDLMDIDVAL